MAQDVSPLHPFAPLLAAASALWRAKWWAIGLSLLGGLLGAWVVFDAEPIYRAEAVLLPVSSRDRGSLDALASELGGLATLAGLNVGGDSAERVALATLRGKEFTARFIQERNLLPVLYSDRWDANANRWHTQAPSLLQAVDRFDRGGIRKIIEDRQSGLVTLQIDWTDADQAVNWLLAMVDSANKQLRENAIAESRRSIEFLTAESERTQSLQVRETIFRLIESQMKQAALAAAQEEFALKFVDRPVLPDSRDYIWPRPLFLVCLGLLIGGVVGGTLALFLESARLARRMPT